MLQNVLCLFPMTLHNFEALADIVLESKLLEQTLAGKCLSGFYCLDCIRSKP